MNVVRYFENRVEKNPDKIFLVEERDGRIFREYTYHQLQRAIRRTAANLAQAGIGPQDCVGIILPNSVELVIGWFAVNYLGAIAGIFEPVLSNDELLAKLNHLEPRLVIGENNVDYFLAKSPLNQVDIYHTNDRDPATIVYSSGTTGNPKGVVESHFNYIFAGEGFAHWMGLTAEDRLYTCLSLARINAQAYSVMGAVAAGATAIIGSKFDRGRGFWKKIANTKATIANTLGGMLRDLNNQPGDAEKVSHDLRLFANGQAIADPDFHENFEKRFGTKVVVMYGSTEQLFGFVMPLDSEKRGGNVVGKQKKHPNYPDSDFGVKINDEGELFLRAPFVTRYWRNPELTAEKWSKPWEYPRHGWYRTGDLFTFNEDGYAIFRGRKDDVIRHSGYLISPVDIEDVIGQHPSVTDVAVIGVKDESDDSTVKALVVAKPEKKITIVELVEFCKSKLTPYKIPQQWEFVTELPRTATERIEKHRLR